MSIYINPLDMTKEDWLANNAKPTVYFPSLKKEARFSIFKKLKEDGYEIVCLVDNVAFTAAAVIDSVSFLNQTCYDSDPRPRTYFTVKSDVLATVLSPEEYALLVRQSKQSHH